MQMMQKTIFMQMMQVMQNVKKMLQAAFKVEVDYANNEDDVETKDDEVEVDVVDANNVDDVRALCA